MDWKTPIRIPAFDRSLNLAEVSCNFFPAVQPFTEADVLSILTVSGLRRHGLASIPVRCHEMSRCGPMCHLLEAQFAVIISSTKSGGNGQMMGTSFVSMCLPGFFPVPRLLYCAPVFGRPAEMRKTVLSHS
jgi:hypothetical protein